jgi:hypothetical protein
MREYRKTHPLTPEQKERQREYCCEYYKAHPLTPEQKEARCMYEQQRRDDPEWLARKKEYNREYMPEWRHHNADAIREYTHTYYHEVRKDDPEYIVISRCRNRLTDAVKAAGTKKYCKTLDLIGCSPAELVSWIESQFKPGMSWDNRSEWHIDHIRPVASFDMLDPEQQRECFRFTNLQPLWAKDNLSKGDTFDG